MSTTTLVLGASPDPSRYAHLAVLRLRAHGHEVIAVGKRTGAIGDITIQRDVDSSAGIDTVTLYLSERNQEAWRDRIVALRPRRVIFNPGAENEGFAKQLKMAGIEALEACTLVMLAAGTY